MTARKTFAWHWVPLSSLAFSVFAVANPNKHHQQPQQHGASKVERQNTAQAREGSAI